MTSKVKKLQRAALRNPAKVQVNTKYTTVKTLVQQYLFIPEKHKDCYLTYVLNEHAGQSGLVFVRTCADAQRCALLLRNLGFKAICLHGKMPQQNRLGALNKFKAGARNILIATDVASRGLDIPSVDMVINFSIPTNAKDYVHRVGRTARAGRAGRAVSFVTQYDVEMYQRIETLLEKRLEAYPADPETVLVMLERVQEAQRIAAIEMREMDQKKGRFKRNRGAEDEGRDFKRKKIRPGRSYGAVPKTGGRVGRGSGPRSRGHAKGRR
jgi:ATP-dependent RNA helicase DDX47/RRP3